jgi:hypothetical protein
MAKTEKELTAMQAETSAEQTETIPADDRVDLFVPRGQVNDEPNLLISINGVNYLLPKGKTSRVKQCVADEYYRAVRAQERYDRKVSEMTVD